MRIGLVDVDGHNFPNLALMKLATYHKQRGDEVEWAFPLLPYDRVYMAKVFTFTQDDITAYQTDDIVRGGTGYDLQGKLLADVENCYPDYSIYGITDTAYGYLTRGCPRGCRFCIVAEKEGKQRIMLALSKELKYIAVPVVKWTYTTQYTGMIFVPAVTERLRSGNNENYARKIK